MANFSSTYPSIRPVFNADFSNAGRLDSRITFSRSDTPPTYAAPSAVHYWSNEKSLSSENLLTYSNPNGAAWNESNGATVSTNASAAPDGTTTASSIVEDSGNSQHRTFISVNASSGETYTLVAYLKANGRTIAQVATSGASAAANVEFDLSGSGTATTRSGSPANSSISQIGSSGWYKCSFQVTAGSTATLYLNLYLCDSADSNTYTGDGSSGVYAYGFNLSTIGQLVHEDTSGQIARQYAPKLKSVSTAGQPRFEYSPTDSASEAIGQSRGLLIEGSSTNIIERSSEFGNVYWGKINSSVIDNAAIAPDGTLTADLIVEASETSPTTNSHYAYRPSITPAASTSYTYSLYLKAAGRNNALLFTSIGGVSGYCNFNLSNGTVAATSGAVVGAISSVSNGWYRCSINWTTTSTASGIVSIYTANSDSTFDYTGNGYSGILCWGAQVEAGHLSSLISTSGSAVTRASDSASAPTADIGLTAGQDVTLYVEGDFGDPANKPNNRLAAALQENSNSYLLIYNGSANSGSGYVRDGGTDQAYFASGITAGAFKSAIAATNNSFKYAANGTSSTEDTAGTLPKYNTLRIGGQSVSGVELDGHIKRVAVYSQSLSSTELAAITS